MIAEQTIYSRLRQTAVRTAEVLGEPSFYPNHKVELEISRESFKTDMLIKKCMSYIDEASMNAGHGLSHAEAVALDAGMVIQVEGRLQDIDSSMIHEIVVYVQIAALLHDIKRKEKDHTIAGSNEARRILNDFLIDDSYKRYIVAAIRNHEAFKGVLESEDEMAELISNSLYDADKFRWGPDNFTTTLWLMLDSNDMPVEKLYEKFPGNLKYIESVKATFRTQTGKKYGPEFIDMGIIIGQAIYKEMSNILDLK
ncbi:MAG: hypothetical protein Q8P40_03245 [Nitrospirota bacterium]|nr:hypothetical protein [Nitrospirota bacterium]